MTLKVSWLPLSWFNVPYPFSSNTPDTSSSRDLRFFQTPERALDFMLPDKFCLEKITRIRKHEGAWESAQSREK